MARRLVTTALCSGPHTHYAHPGAVGACMQTTSQEYDMSVIGVDIGGATTDVFSVFGEFFNRTVSPNLV